MSSVMLDERVSDEIEALKAILFENELNIIQNDESDLITLELLLFPATGIDENSKYVCITLVADLILGYPDKSPVITFKNPRGLDEKIVNKLKENIEAKCKHLLGQPMMFELIELVKEELTKSNFPSGNCAICLCEFHDQDQFTKTDCYHYFHSYCLLAHIVASEKNYKEEQEHLSFWQRDKENNFKAYCPVCRKVIDKDIKNLSLAPPPKDYDKISDDFLDEKILEVQSKLNKLFLHQQQNGGVINRSNDLEFLLQTEIDEYYSAIN